MLRASALVWMAALALQGCDGGSDMNTDGGSARPRDTGPRADAPLPPPPSAACDPSPGGGSPMLESIPPGGRAPPTVVLLAPPGVALGLHAIGWRYGPRFE